MKPFTDAEQQRISQAVRQAELVTKGEIVPMIVPVSRSRLSDGAHAGPAPDDRDLGAVLGWHAGNTGWLLLAVVASCGFGQWLGRIPRVIRLVTSRERLAHKVALRAKQAFYKHGLHQTQGRTGVLIFVSLLERRVQVLADKGLNDHVPAGTWDGVVGGIVDGIKTGQATDAICAAIATGGTLLAQVSPAGSGDNSNELSNSLIQEP